MLSAPRDDAGAVARGEGSGARRTRQRTAVHAALHGNDQFVSAQTLHHQLRDGGDSVGLATVYRQLHQLAAEGEADVVVSGNEGTLYRVCATRRPHHHLICRECGRTAELESAVLERWAQEVGEAHAFTDLHPTAEVLGTCRSCV